MKGNYPEITLMGFFGMGPVQNVVKTRLIGGPYVRFADFVTVSAYLFQSGALLGRAKLGELLVLAKMFSETGRESDVIKWVQELANKRFEEFQSTFEEIPSSFTLFFMATEYKKAGILTPFGQQGKLTNTIMNQVAKVANVKKRLKEAEPAIKQAFLEGVGFGSLFPELTERIYRFNESIDVDDWSRYKDWGLDISEKPTIVTLEEQEQIVLDMVAVYAQAYFPELMQPLNLTKVPD